MRAILLISVIYLLVLNSSCTLYKQLSNQKFDYRLMEQEFKILDNKMILDTKVEGNLVPFVFDSGASLTIIMDSEVLGDFHEKKFSSFGRTTLADSTRVRNKIFTIDQFETAFLKATNKAAIFLNANLSQCDSLRFRGIIGTDIFVELPKDVKLLLDFDKNIISLKLIKDLDSIIVADNYHLIPASFTNQGIYPIIKIGGKEEKVFFDTGFSGFLLSSKGELEYEKSFTVDGKFLSTVNTKTDGQFDFFTEIPFEFAGVQIEGDVIYAHTPFMHNVLGLMFIKNFNWIVDYPHKRIYAKRNLQIVDKLVDEIKDNYLGIIEDRIKIIAIKSGYSKHSIGTEITSVKNQIVTNENICDLFYQLNSTKDWDSLEVIVK